MGWGVVERAVTVSVILIVGVAPILSWLFIFHNLRF